MAGVRTWARSYSLFMVPTLVFFAGLWLSLHEDEAVLGWLGTALAACLCILQGVVRHDTPRSRAISVFGCMAATVVLGLVLYFTIAASIECDQFDNCLLS